MNRRDVMLSSQAHAPALETFLQAANAACNREGWRSSEVIRYWLEAAFRSMRAAVTLGEVRDQNEAEYMKIVDQCRRKETPRDLATMLGATVEALEADPVDFIGPIYSAFAANARAGQFFTPHSVSLMMAEMQIGDLASIEQLLADAGRSYLLCSEPACGVGGMVLAAHAVMKARGLQTHRQAHWIVVDVDSAAMFGAYIQCNLCGVSADVVHGNTLSLEEWMTTPTLAAVMHPKLAHRKAAAQPEPTAQAPVVAKRSQLTFDFVEA